ncbi:NADH-quinone oxidoreductase subunit N [Colwellia hornerae]|uniref:NADH-quinone oxidoreductase subunit N n=1 Tax=Colwellia hornerae TaxID=89402 RepID=A0A5C6QP26_9GAMM|nr:NADH-quinone oxidoreductase subunit N [Colwellia hornerae]TWX56274.1 NADH-quinone oxidoreductase subunit N [Colwellia hornerae]TWX62125.1 NADH-quinone oxidoreductase subunit N [Colwellia hornerae]TWX70527.1 NADH-quinone oxidoreductase subunit N [Colwellia hornerae]
MNPVDKVSEITLMNTEMFIVLSPILLLSFGIVLSLLLIAWQRSQKIIALFSQLILVFTLLLSMHLLSSGILSGAGVQITPLLKVDQFSYLSLSLICLSALAVISLSKQVLKSQVEVHDEYYLLILLVILGAAILVASDHFASMFLGFELLSISLVGLVGYFREQKYAVETGFKYLILSACASSFMLLGIAFIYSQTGNLSFAINSATAPWHSAPLQLFNSIGVLLLFSGIAFKLSLAPFHFWAPDVYQGAPTPITLLMATVSKIAMFTVLMKCCFAQGYYQNDHFIDVIIAVALLSMFIGNTLALKQQNIKRLMAYSSIAHFGYLLIVLVISAEQSIGFAWRSALFYLTAYLLANVAIFSIVITYEQYFSQNSTEREVCLNDWQAMFWQHRAQAVLLVFSILSLAGIPLTMGFVGKFYLFNQAVISQSWWLITGLVIGSGIGLAYYLPIIFTVFKVNSSAATHITKDNAIKAPKIFIIFLIIISFYFGVFPDSLSQYLL